MENSSVVWEFPNCEFKEAKAASLNKKAKSFKSNMPVARGVLGNLSVTAPADSATNALNIMKATVEVTKTQQPSLGNKLSFKKGKSQSKVEKEGQMSKKSEDKDSRFLIDWINYTFDRMQLISTENNFNGDETMDNMSFNASMISVNQKMACQDYAYGIKQVYDNETDESLRKAGYELYCSENVLGVIKKVEKAVERGVFMIREDRELEVDLGLQESFFELLFSYDMSYLTLGVQIIFGEKVLVKKNKKNMRFTLKNLIIAKLLKVEFEVGETFKKNNSLKMVEKKKKELLHQHILKKFFSLVLFLDQSRLLALHTKGTLFEKNSSFKASKDIINAFCTLLLKAEGDIIKHLGNLGYSVSFTQSYLDEFDFKVSDLRADLKDGVRLTRLYELLTGVSAVSENYSYNELSNQLRVPAISRLQKIHNNRLILEAMGVFVSVTGVDYDSKKIADGDLDTILIVLWKLLFQFELQGDSTNKKGFLTKDQIRKEISLLQQENTSKLDFSDTFSSPQIEENEDFTSLLLTWIQLVVEPYGLPVYDLIESLADGSLLAFVINYYHPALLPLAAIKEAAPVPAAACEVPGQAQQQLQQVSKHNWKCIKLATKAIGGIPTTILLPSNSNGQPVLQEENMLIFLTRFFMRLTESATQIRAVLVLQRWYRSRFAAGSSKGVKREVKVRQHASSRFRRLSQTQQRSLQQCRQAESAAGSVLGGHSKGKGGEKKESRFAQWRRATLENNSTTIISKSPKLILKANSSDSAAAVEEDEGEEEEEVCSDENSPVPVLAVSGHSLVDDINDAVHTQQSVEEEHKEQEEEAWVDLSAVLAIHQDINDKGVEGEDEHQLDDLLGLLSDDDEDEAEAEAAAAALAMAEAQAATAAATAALQAAQDEEAAILALALQKQAEEEEQAEQERQRLINLELKAQAAAELLAKQQAEEAEVVALALAKQQEEEAAALAAAIVAEEEEKQRQAAEAEALLQAQEALLIQQQLEEEEAATVATSALATAEFEAAVAWAKQQEQERAEAEAFAATKAAAEEAALQLALQLQLEKEQAEAKAAAALAAAIAQAEAKAAAEAAAAQVAEAAMIKSEVSSLLIDITEGIIAHQAFVLHMTYEIIDTVITSSCDEAELLYQRRLFEAELQRQIELQRQEELMREQARVVAQRKHELLVQHCALVITRCFKYHHILVVTKRRVECETAAALCLQCNIRRYSAQKKYRCAILAVSILQAMHRKKSILRAFKIMHAAMTKIASCVRGFLVRKTYNKLTLTRETRVLQAKQHIAKLVLYKYVSKYLWQKKMVKAVCIMQKMVRAKVVVMSCVKKMMALCKNGMNRLKALYRGYHIRKHAKKNIRAMLLRLRQAKLRWSEGGPLTLGQKTIAALQALQTAKWMSDYFAACDVLRISTQYSRDSCEKFVYTNSTVILLQVIQSCNRGELDEKLIRLVLVILLNVCRYPALATYIGNHIADPTAGGSGGRRRYSLRCCEVLIDVLQMFRDKSVFPLAAHLLTIIVHASESSKMIISSHDNHKRLDDMIKILESKHRIHMKCKAALKLTPSPVKKSSNKVNNKRGTSSPKQREEMYRELDAVTCLRGLIAALN